MLISPGIVANLGVGLDVADADESSFPKRVGTDGSLRICVENSPLLLYLHAHTLIALSPQIPALIFFTKAHAFSVWRIEY
jgi:hypothetical protein